MAEKEFVVGFSVPRDRLRPAVRLGGAALLAALLVAPVALTSPAALAQSRAVEEPRSAQTIAINDGSNADPFPSRLTVAGVPGLISDVDLVLYDVRHKNPDDIDILLVGPNDEAVIVLSDVGGGADIDNLDIVIDDQASDPAPPEARLGDRHQPTNDAGTGDAPDELGSEAPDPDGLTMARFTDINPNGVWRLYVRDDTDDFAGSISGWSLRIETYNNAPLANNDRYKTKENQKLRVSTRDGVLANDTDPDGDDDKIFVYIKSGNPSKTLRTKKGGKVTIFRGGSFIYEPKIGFVGRDSFTYEVADRDIEDVRDRGKVVIQVTD